MLFGHAYNLGGRQPAILTRSLTDTLLRQTASGVWLFFVISGYLIAKPFVTALIKGDEPPAAVPYAIRRSLRIYPAYWLALTTVIIVAGAGATKIWQYPFHYVLLNNLVPRRQAAIFSVAWTLTIEVIFYICVPILASLVRAIARRKPIAPATLAIGIIVTWAMSLLWNLVVDAGLQPLDRNWMHAVFPARWCYFCPGLLLIVLPWLRPSSLTRAVTRLSTGTLNTIVCVVLIGIGFLTNVLAARATVPFVESGLFDAGQQLYTLAFGLLVARALTPHAARRTRRWAVELGLISYGIYLYHSVFMYAFVHAGKNLIPLPHDGALAYVVHVTLILALTLPVAWLSWYFFEKPLNDLAHRISRRSAPAQSSSPAYLVEPMKDATSS